MFTIVLTGYPFRLGLLPWMHLLTQGGEPIRTLAVDSVSSVALVARALEATRGILARCTLVAIVGVFFTFVCVYFVNIENDESQNVFETWYEIHVTVQHRSITFLKHQICYKKRSS